MDRNGADEGREVQWRDARGPPPVGPPPVPRYSGPLEESKDSLGAIGTDSPEECGRESRCRAIKEGRIGWHEALLFRQPKRLKLRRSGSGLYGQDNAYY